MPPTEGPEEGTLSATAQGLAAIALWCTLASLTTLVPQIPPFQLTAMAFTVATLVGGGYALATGASLAAMVRVPVASLALGVYGLLGYHVCYFAAFKLAPAVEANLVNYLWPLLIVLFSGLLPASAGGRTLRWWHLAGAVMGFAGTGLLLSGQASAPGSGDNAGSSSQLTGLLAALAAALIWSSFSVASRLFRAVPAAALAVTCAMTALGALALHLALEQTVWPAGAFQWLVILAQGVGPVGLAFYLWDSAMKHGHLRLVGVAAYATPLLSTLLLTALGLGSAGPTAWLAALLVTAGAVLAGHDILRKPH